MPKTHDHTHESSRAAVLAALTAAGDVTLDSYQVARRAKLTPMQAGRCLLKLYKEGLVHTDDSLGSINDLAAQFKLKR